MAEAVKGAYDLINSEKKKESSSIEPKEFFWDQFIKYIASAILALTVLNVTVEFLRGGGVSCFPPSDNVGITARDLEGRMLYEFGRGQTSYINNYCARSIPKTEYFPIYILIHGLLLIVPHYIWNALHNGNFDSFFSIVDKLDRLRDKSGEYDSKNFNLVTKLELEYSGRTIYYTYILKLLLQLAVCVGSLSFSSWYFLDCDFSFSFCCPNDNSCTVSEEANITCPVNITGRIPKGWPLILNVPCVYSSLRVLNLVRYADFFLLGIAVLLVLFGLIWCFVRHTEQLGHEAIAKFSYHSCLNANLHSFPSPIFWPVYKFYQQSVDPKKRQKLIKYFWLFTHYPQLHLTNLFLPRILNDLDFLLLMLFRADTSHGQVFKDIQISKDLKVFIGRDHQLLHLYINVQQDYDKDAQTRALQPRSEPAQPSTDEREADGDVPVELVVTSPSRVTVEDKVPTDFHMMFLADYDNPNDGNKSTTPKNTTPEEAVFDHFKDYLGNLNYDEELFSGMRDWIYYFVRTFGPKRDQLVDGKTLLRNTLALDVSFGSVGFVRVLARPFKKVVSLDFHPFFCNPEQVVESKEFYTNYKSVKVPFDIFVQNSNNISKMTDTLEKFINAKRHLIDFIVIGPLTEEPKKAVVNLLINLLFTAEFIGKEATLLAVRPLKVGSKKLTTQFYSYEPPKQLFEAVLVQKKLEESPVRKKKMRKVDNCDGVKVVLGQIPCVFEFKVYKYKYEHAVKPADETDGGDATRQSDKNNPFESQPSNSSVSDLQQLLENFTNLPPPPHR